VTPCAGLEPNSPGDRARRRQRTLWHGPGCARNLVPGHQAHWRRPVPTTKTPAPGWRPDRP